MTVDDIHTTVWVRTSFVALHSWEDAPEQVKYLRSPHRHKFNVFLAVRTDADREVEFHMLKHKLDGYIQSSFVLTSTTDLEYDIVGIVPTVNLSCEVMARRILQHFTAAIVTVDEDGENGATVTRTL